MPTYSQGPRLLKGAIVAVDLASSKQTTIAFQYNPETLTRTLTPRQTAEPQQKGQRASALRFSGAPAESFTLEIHLDASDALEKGDATAGSLGIYPQLFALEVLAYPASEQVVENDKLQKQGKMEVASGYDAPLTLLVWGAQRVLPVQLTSITVTEKIFDTHLNPVQATVSLHMNALTYSDLDPTHKGYSLFLAYQKSKERQARQGVTGGDTAELLGVDVRARLREA
jgi:hypothetical protein